MGESEHTVFRIPPVFEKSCPRGTRKKSFYNEVVRFVRPKILEHSRIYHANLKTEGTMAFRHLFTHRHVLEKFDITAEVIQAMKQQLNIRFRKLSNVKSGKTCKFLLFH